MKLLYCLSCRDVRSLTQTKRYCSCRRSSGQYIDNRNATYQGPSVLLGMINNELLAVKPDEGLGRWFVIPESASTVSKTDLVKEMGHKEKK